jgi:glycosyltransferase involved in cell wall biosynthesis
MNKIVILFENYSHYHIARVATFQSIVKHEWEVIGLEITRDGVDYQWKTDIENSQVKIISILGDLKPNQVIFLEQIKIVFSVLDELNPDVLVIAGYRRLIMNLSLLWSKWKNKLAILLSDSKEDDAKRNLIAEQIKGSIIKRFDSALVAGNKHKEYLVKLGMSENSIFKGYDVVDNNTFNPKLIGNLSKPLNEKFFLAINRFIEKKNLPFLISAYASYHHKTDDPWHLVLCGNGELRDQLESLIIQYNLQDFVHLPGFLQQNELLPYFAHANCFIHASVQEQWGLVVNEAMAAGLPVLVSNRCGCYEDLIIEGVTGFGFNPENMQQLTDLMLKMSSGKIDLHKMGSAALEHIQKFSPDYFAQGLKNAVEYALSH